MDGVATQGRAVSDLSRRSQEAGYAPPGATASPGRSPWHQRWQPWGPRRRLGGESVPL